jgi:hypothetical protein
MSLKNYIAAANNKVGVLPSLKNAAQAGMTSTFLNVSIAWIEVEYYGLSERMSDLNE